MPVARARYSELGVLRSNAGGELRLEHLVHHSQPGRRGEGEQALMHRTGDVRESQADFLGQTFQLSGVFRPRDLDDRYFLLHRWSPSWVVLGW
jgi:hypothetical protein